MSPLLNAPGSDDVFGDHGEVKFIGLYAFRLYKATDARALDTLESDMLSDLTGAEHFKGVFAQGLRLSRFPVVHVLFWEGYALPDECDFHGGVPLGWGAGRATCMSPVHIEMV